MRVLIEEEADIEAVDDVRFSIFEQYSRHTAMQHTDSSAIGSTVADSIIVDCISYLLL